MVGGAQVYAEALPLAAEQIISEIPLEPEGDVLYPAFDPNAWIETDRERFDGYERVWLERAANRVARSPDRLGRMELRVFTEPQQGATYDDLVAVAQEAERLGFGAFFRSDHYLGMGTDGLPGPSDAWITLAGLARETSTIRLGTMMTSATFRHPGPLAISVANVDQMSGGRVELGIGAGWFDAGAHGVRHPVPGHGGALRPVRGAARDHHRAVGDRRAAFAFDGAHYQVTDRPACRSRPSRSRRC